MNDAITYRKLLPRIIYLRKSLRSRRGVWHWSLCVGDYLGIHWLGWIENCQVSFAGGTTYGIKKVLQVDESITLIMLTRQNTFTIYERLIVYKDSLITCVQLKRRDISCFVNGNPDSKVHGTNMGPICGRQDPDGPHVGTMNLAIWEGFAADDACPSENFRLKRDAYVQGPPWSNFIPHFIMDEIIYPCWD